MFMDRFQPTLFFSLLLLGLFSMSCDGGSSSSPDGGDADTDTDTDTDADTDTDGECPPDMVEIPGFDACIDSYEYTNSKFLEFLNDHGNDCGEAECRRMGEESSHCFDAYDGCLAGEVGDIVTCRDFTQEGDGYVMASDVGDFPVGWVTWYGARDACLWEGKTLCPWDLWYAGCSHGGEWHFPYGGTTGGVDDKDGYFEDWEFCMCNDGNHYFNLQVGSFPDCEGGYDGLFDMAGNLAEWGGTEELDGVWGGMGGSHLTISGDGDGPWAGAGCKFPGDWLVDEPAVELPLEIPDFTSAATGFRCCYFLD